jgi:hypothetical protein
MFHAERPISARAQEVRRVTLVKLGGFMLILGGSLYVFAKLSRWRYSGGLASWAPTVWRIQERVGVVLAVVGLPVLVVGIAIGS